MTSGRQRLACLTTSSACGGAETSLLTLLAALRRLEPEWAIAVVAPSDGPMLEHCRDLEIEAVVLPYPPALQTLGETGAIGAGRRTSRGQFIRQGLMTAVTMPQYVTALRRTLRQLGATVVHSNGVKAHISAALARPAGVRLVWHLHDYVQSRPLTATLLRRLARRADAIVANSDSVRQDASSALGTGREVRRIYNAVDGGRFSAEGPALDLAGLAGLPGDDGLVRIGLVATFARWKGHETFVDAIGRLHARSRVRGYIIGGPVYETAGSQWSMDELRTAVASAGLSDVIGLTGPIADVPAAMRRLDVLVHASTSPEPFGMVIAEGMACGRAVVASAGGGASELFEDGVNARGHRAGDAADLARVLDALVSSGEARLTLGAAARETARQRFAPACMAAAFREAYRG